VCGLLIALALLFVVIFLVLRVLLPILGVVRTLPLFRLLILLAMFVLRFALLVLCHCGLRLVDTELRVTVSRKNRRQMRCKGRNSLPPKGRQEGVERGRLTTERFLARRFLTLTIVLVLWALVPIIPLIFLGLNRIVAHPLRVIHLLLITLTLLLVGHGLCTAHLELLSYS